MTVHRFRKTWLGMLAWASAAVVLVSQWGMTRPLPDSAPPRPNFILIIADDMAWNDSGAYGHEKIRTPHIDRLAREGLRFERAFVTASSCSPSRASLITGRYPHNTGAEQLHWPLPAAQLTFVEFLRKAGYWTAAVGKWHLGDAIKDRFDLVREADPAGYQLPADQAGSAEPGTVPGGPGSGATQWVPTLRERPADKPFLLWLASLDPHRDYEDNIIARPHTAEEAQVPPYLPDVPEVRRDLARYYDEIARLDTCVGAVLSELDRQGAGTNTLVLFLSDNGRPFPRDKTTLYDGGIRTPWIVRWPVRIRPGGICSGLVSTVDIAPTFLELAGAARPDKLEGYSLVPLLSQPDLTVRDHIFAERHWHDYEAYARAVRSERFKYIRNYYPDLPNTPPADAVRSPTFRVMQRLRATGRLSNAQMNCFLRPRPPEELYDLENDPFELNNLVEDRAHRWVLNGLRRELTNWQLATRDTPPDSRTPDEFDRETGRPLPNRVRPRLPKGESKPGDVTQ